MRRNTPERPQEPREDGVVCCPICGAESPQKVVCEPGIGVLGCDICLCMYDARDYFEEGRV